MQLFLMIKITLVFLFAGFLFPIDKLPDVDSFDWKKIRTGDIIVEYSKQDDIPWCRAYIDSDYSIEEISIVLEDKANYSNVFDRITETQLYTKDVVHIKLDMPLPWAGRDYIVKYTENSFAGVKEYKWVHYDDLNIPVEDGYVRLPRAAGKWKLVKLENGKTQIQYIWNGELLGNFPSWGLKIAWKEQGVEVLTWLIDYMDNK